MPRYQCQAFMNNQIKNKLGVKTPIQSLKGDIYGGLVTAIIAIPGNVAFGIIAFAPLGSEYMGIGILAGMYTSIFASSVAAILGRTRIMISGPEAPSALLIAGLINQIISSGRFDISVESSMVTLLTMTFFTVFLSGLFHIIFGILRLGVLIKFISYPVIAGIINGTALLILVGQIGPFLGIQSFCFLNLFSHLQEISIPYVVVSFSTFGFIMWGGKVISKIPSSIQGLIGGTILFYFLNLLGFSQGLGGDLGEIQSGLPNFSYLTRFVSLPMHASFMDFFPIIISTAFTIAVLHSVNSLLAAVYLRSLNQIRPDGNLELIGQGIGNMAVSFFGGLPADGHIGRSVVNFETGGRSKLSVVFSSLFILVFIAFFGKAIGIIPKAVMSGVVVAIAFMIADRSVLGMLKKILNRQISANIETIVNFGIVILVMAVTITVNLVVAVLVGIVVSLAVFISQMSRSVIRRTHYGSHFNSKKQRFLEAMKIISENKDKIVVVELQGALFFGSADGLGQKIEQLAEEGAQYIVIDLKRLTHVDTTGAKILSQTQAQLQKKNCRLCLSYLSRENDKYAIMKDSGVIDAIGEYNVFHDTSEAVESCEDDMLEHLAVECGDHNPVPIRKLLEYHGLNEPDIGIICGYLEKVSYRSGDMIVRQGEQGDSMFFVESGRADVIIELNGFKNYKRLLTITPGSIFGEMAILDGAPRAADIVVVEPTTCYFLTIAALNSLKKHHPKLAMQLYIILARLISHRLRTANDTIAELET